MEVAVIMGLVKVVFVVVMVVLRILVVIVLGTILVTQE